MVKFYRFIFSFLAISLSLFYSNSISANVTITAPTLTITTCSTFPTSYNPLGNIVITEGASGDFSDNTTGRTLIFTAPANFEFLNGAGSVTATAGNNIDETTIAISVTTSSVTVTYDVSGTNKTDAITISGLMIRATAASAAVNMTRTGGTGTVAGLVNGTTVATFSCSSVASPTAGTAIANLTNPCVSQTVLLYLSGSTTGTYQWQSSTDNITFNNI